MPTSPEKLDVNELIHTATVFTNTIGMELKKVNDSLWVGTHEVDQKEYQEVALSNPSAFSGESHPVDSVFWVEATRFCAELTQHKQENDMLPEGYVYSLPTQSQWESPAANVPLSQAVTSLGGSRSGTSPVGSLGASATGLHDLRGNVAERCADSASENTRVLRGGSWEDWIEPNLRLQFRYYAQPNEARNTFGFRWVLTPSSSKPAQPTGGSGY